MLNTQSLNDNIHKRNFSIEEIDATVKREKKNISMFIRNNTGQILDRKKFRNHQELDDNFIMLFVMVLSIISGVLIILISYI